MLEKGQVFYEDRTFDWTIVSAPSETDLASFGKLHDFPIELSTLNKETDISYYSAMTSDYYDSVSVLHLPVWGKDTYGTMDSAESTVTFVFSENMVVCVLNGLDSTWISRQLNSDSPPHHIMIDIIRSLYNDIEDRLSILKRQIESLKIEAKEKADRDVLLNLTDLEEELVFFSKRIDDFDDTISQWLQDRDIVTHTNNSDREMIALRIKKSQYNSHLYKELIESTSGLVSDSIDNKLNSIMEFLESVALVISIPTLIFSLFGMNTGGLAGRQSPLGTVIVIGVSLVLGIVMALYLKRKDYL